MSFTVTSCNQLVVFSIITVSNVSYNQWCFQLSEHMYLFTESKNE